jgi:general secretion pathway protein F
MTLFEEDAVSMPRYRYKAKSPNGQMHTGELEASDADAVSVQLTADGMTVLGVELVEDLAGSEGSAQDHRTVSLKPSDFVEMSGQISDLVGSNLPLAPGLAALAEELPRSRLRRGLNHMVAELESGKDVADVLDTQGAPTGLSALIRAGIRSGHPAEVLGMFVAHSRSMTDGNRRILIALLYPALLFLATILVFGAALIYIVPGFKKIFEDFGTQLPAITQSIITLSDFFVAAAPWFGPLLLAAVVLFAIQLLLFRRVPELRRWLSHMPVIGPASRWTSMARFTRLLAILVENNIPLPEALRLAGNGTNDGDIRTASGQLAEAVASGEPLSPSMHAITGFPATFLQILVWENQARALSSALHALADMFEGRARIQFRFVLMIIQPMFLVVIGLSMGYLAIALFMPLIKLLNDLA